jgi:acyl-coenzyme A thioesterase PaaI-like protein
LTGLDDPTDKAGRTPTAGTDPVLTGDGPPATAPGDGDFVRRVAAATALRRLGHALVAHEVDDETLALIASEAGRWSAALEDMPDRVRPPLDTTRSSGVTDTQGGGRSRFPDGIVTGQTNPMGMAGATVRQGNEAVLRATLGAAFEGAPGRAHGGTVATLFDEVMGFVASIHAAWAFTGRLTVTYRAPTPIGVELEVRARLHSRHGRKLRIDAEARADGAVVAEAEGVFIAVDPERFAAR